LLLALARAVILGFESRGTHDHVLLSQIRDSPNLDGQVPVFISPRKRVAQLYLQTLGSLFVASYDSRATVEVFDLASTRDWLLVLPLISMVIVAAGMSYDTDNIENDASNISPIVVCVFIFRENVLTEPYPINDRENTQIHRQQDDLISRIKKVG
jgi:hypothetical protein